MFPPKRTRKTPSSLFLSLIPTTEPRLSTRLFYLREDGTTVRSHKRPATHLVAERRHRGDPLSDQSHPRLIDHGTTQLGHQNPRLGTLHSIQENGFVRSTWLDDKPTLARATPGGGRVLTNAPADRIHLRPAKKQSGVGSPTVSFVTMRAVDIEVSSGALLN